MNRRKFITLAGLSMLGLNCKKEEIMPNRDIVRKVLLGGVVTPYVWDDDALSYIANFSDISLDGKKAINNLVVAYKNASIWTALKYAIINPQTLSATECLRDLKNNTIYASGINEASENCAANFPIGYHFRVGSTDFLDAGRTFGAMGALLASTCVIFGQKRDRAAADLFDWGVIQGASQRAYFRAKSATSDSISSHMYASANGIFKGSNTDARGIYSVNRTGTTYIECAKDGAVVQTSVITASPTLPSINSFIGAYNSGGGAASHASGIVDFWAVHTGLTDTQRAAAEAAWAQYRVDMGRSGNYTKSIVMDGNSLTQKIAQRMFRKAIFGLGLNNYNVHNIGVSGQTTADMITRYPTYGAPKYDGTLSKNIYIALEIGNDLYKSAITVATAKQNMIDLIALAKATGFTTICMVPQARTYVGNTASRTETQFNLDMDEMVQWVRAGSSAADYIVDVNSSNLWVDRSAYASDALYNTAIAAICANGTYFTDGTHLTATGYDLRGANITTTLQTAL